MANLNINLTGASRKKYTIDGDENRVLEINTTDLGVISRLTEVEADIEKVIEEFSNDQSKFDFENLDDLKLASQKLKEVDVFIREKLDYLFDTNFSEVCAPHGTMLDPIDGSLRFTYLIEVMADVYTDSLSEALKKRADTMQKHTKKYVKKVK